MIGKNLTGSVFIAALIGASTFAFAKGDRIDNFLTLELGLDETRAAQVKEIFQEARDSAREMKLAHFEQMEAHKEQTKSQLSTILTEEEMKQLEQMREKKQKRMFYGERRGPGFRPEE